MISGNWLAQSLTATVLLVPIYLAIGFFNQNFQIRPDVFLVWYFLGTAVTSALFGNAPFKALAPSWQIVCAMFLVGLIAGGIANIQLFRAVAGAPNPGLPVVIANTASIGVFLLAILLAKWVPNYFRAASIDAWSLTGIAMTVLGISIIALRR